MKLSEIVQNFNASKQEWISECRGPAVIEKVKTRIVEYLDNPRICEHNTNVDVVQGSEPGTVDICITTDDPILAESFAKIKNEEQ